VRARFYMKGIKPEGGEQHEVRANLVYRDFTRVGAGKMPDAKTMGRWGPALGPQVIKQIHAGTRQSDI
jgi:hypothetical protein